MSIQCSCGSFILTVVYYSTELVDHSSSSISCRRAFVLFPVPSPRRFRLCCVNLLMCVPGCRRGRALARSPVCLHLDWILPNSSWCQRRRGAEECCRQKHRTCGALPFLAVLKVRKRLCVRVRAHTHVHRLSQKENKETPVEVAPGLSWGGAGQEGIVLSLFSLWCHWLLNYVPYYKGTETETERRKGKGGDR